jgi:hypothetical protein
MWLLAFPVLMSAGQLAIGLVHWLMTDSDESSGVAADGFSRRNSARTSNAGGRSDDAVQRCLH